MAQHIFRDEKTLTISSVEVSEEDREAILKDILERNALRRRAGIPPYDVEAQAEREAADLADAMYEDRLRPYVELFYDQIVGSPGLAGYAATINLRLLRQSR